MYSDLNLRPVIGCGCGGIHAGVGFDKQSEVKMEAVRSINAEKKFVPYVSPETKVRREIRAYQTQVRKLKRQIAAQYKLESLKAEAEALCVELDRLRDKSKW